MSVTNNNRWAIAAVIFCGIGVPLASSSPTVFGVALALGVLLSLAAPGRLELFLRFSQGLRSPLGLAIIFSFLLWLPGTAESPDLGRSFSIWGRMVGMLVIVTFIHYFLRRGGVDTCLRAMIVAALFCALITLLGLYATSPIYGLFRGKGWVEVNTAQILKYYGSALACLAPAVIWAGLRLGRRWLFAGLLHLAAAFAIILAVDSLAGLLGLVAGMVIGSVVYVCQRWRLLGGRAAGLFLALLALFLLAAMVWTLDRLPTLPDPDQIIDRVYGGPVETEIPTSLVDAHRQYIWGFSLDKALEAPYFGHGIDISNYLPGASVLVAKFNQTFIPSHPHSWFLEIFLETGAFGLVALLAALALLVHLWLRLGATSPSTAAAGIAVFVAFWSSSMLNFSIWSAWWQGVFLVLTAILLAAALRDAQTSPLPREERQPPE